jgi:hypothetical protein
MKKCPYCGLENPDERSMCSTCQNPLTTPAELDQATTLEMKEEKNFWDNMTFKQFAVFIVRLQAVWFIFYFFVELTYLPTFIARVPESTFRHSDFSDARHSLFLLIIRILLHAAAALFLIQRAETVVG